MKRIIKIVFWTIAVLVIIQFIPVDKINKPVKKSENFVDIFKTPTHIQQTLKNACYDCHSNETVYPNYAMFAPISWAIISNVDKGRVHMNLSEWGTYNKDLKMGMLRNAIANIEQSRMPKQGYIAQHPEARLTEEEKQELITYLSEILESNHY